MNLFQRINGVSTSNPYFPKDLSKAKRSNKFIGRGSAASSTNKYRIAAGDLGNSGAYFATDTVFISAEGNRGKRVGPDYREIILAAHASVTFITDDAANRNRPYNIGEREVAVVLNDLRYREAAPGVWVPPLD